MKFESAADDLECGLCRKKITNIGHIKALHTLECRKRLSGERHAARLIRIEKCMRSVTSNERRHLETDHTQLNTPDEDTTIYSKAAATCIDPIRITLRYIDK